MKLQILITQYNETDDIVKDMLDSIEIQQNVDFNDIGVIIVNDGSDIYLSDELLNSYSFKIEYYKDEHKGISGARDGCMRRAVADYIMFCDADDMFYNNIALWIILSKTKKNFDVMNSVFIEEAKTSGGPLYLRKEAGPVFVHGKVYRRQYLLDNDISWNPALTVHEDSYFNMLALKLTDKVEICPTPFYIWRWRDSSVCRNDKDYILKTYPNLIQSSEACLDEFLKRDKIQIVSDLCTSFLINTYCTLEEDKWKEEENKEYRKNTIFLLEKYFNKFKKYYEQNQEDRIINLFTSIVKKRKMDKDLSVLKKWLQKMI